MSSRPPLWSKLHHIIVEAAELAPRERERFVAEACKGDRELECRVDAVLRGTAGGEDFLAALAGRAGLPFVPEDENPPAGLERVGSYRLLRRIGEGGMGVVYLAERADGEFHLRVAVKLLAAGHHTAAMRRRFADERQILARLSHPAIGRLLDAGTTDGGIPFLVMEYSAGVPIDIYCDDNLLTIDARLDLFARVCEAVEFAHSHGVVHRDLKPSNILVSSDGVVKLLDFGIAKILDEDSTSEATLTASGHTPMSPAYASPEQIVGEPVGLGSDVYQLSALLYLLLTGRHPFDPVDMRSWAERARAVASRRDVPASVAVGMAGHSRGGLPGPSAEERARVRAASVRTLRARFAGSLDAILLKGLRRDLVLRYTSVASMAGDLRGSRESRPVAANLEMTLQNSGLRPVETAPLPIRTLVQPAPDTAPPVAGRIAVLPFTCAEGEDLAYLRLGLVSLLSTALDGSDALTVVEPTSVLAALRGDDPRPMDAPLARRVAERLGAGLYITGDVLAVGDSLRVTAALHSVREDGTARAHAVAEGSPDQVLQLVDSLAVDILCQAAPPHSAELVRAAARSTSLAPFKLFLKGEQALHAGSFFPAAEAFQSAVGADPDFALAYYRLTMAAYWAHNLGLTRRFAAEAAARGERLPPRERSLLSALQLYLDGNAAAAERSYSQLLEDAPGDLEAAFLLGTLLFFHNPLCGRSRAEARPWFERVLASQPEHILSLLYLSTIVAQVGALPALDAITERLLAAYPDGGLPAYPLVARAQRAFAGDSVSDQDRVLDELHAAGSLAAITACQVSVLPHKDLSGPRRIVQVLLSDDDVGVRASGLVLRAHIELGSGRITAAARDLDAATTLGMPEAIEFQALFAVAPFLPQTRNVLEEIRARMLGSTVADLLDAPPPIPHFAPHHGTHTHVRRFVLGLIHARLGSYDDALDDARQLEAAAPALGDVALAGFAATIRADVAGLRSGPAEALAILEAHNLSTSVERALSSSFYSHGHARLTKAGLLHAVGRSDEAMAWYRTLGNLTIQDAVYLAPAQLGQAEIFRERGDVQHAAACYDRFLHIWRDCDPVLRPMVDAAREARAGLLGC